MRIAQSLWLGAGSWLRRSDPSSPTRSSPTAAQPWARRQILSLKASARYASSREDTLEKIRIRALLFLLQAAVALAQRGFGLVIVARQHADAKALARKLRLEHGVSKR